MRKGRALCSTICLSCSFISLLPLTVLMLVLCGVSLILVQFYSGVDALWCQMPKCWCSLPWGAFVGPRGSPFLKGVSSTAHYLLSYLEAHPPLNNLVFLFPCFWALCFPTLLAIGITLPLGLDPFKVTPWCPLLLGAILYWLCEFLQLCKYHTEGQIANLSFGQIYPLSKAWVGVVNVSPCPSTEMNRIL